MIDHAHYRGSRAGRCDGRHHRNRGRDYLAHRQASTVSSARIVGRATRAGIVGVGVYNGYFGADSGVLMIAVLLIAGQSSLHRANALKNVLLLAADILPAVVFAVSGHVIWLAAVSLGAGAVVGGLIGPTLARRLPQALLRVAIACCSVALAVYLFIAITMP